MMTRVLFALTLVVSLALTVVAPALAVPAADTLVNTGSPATPFPRNKQNEPALAINANHPLMLAAGANDEIDLEPCAGPSCPFTPGVGLSGVYFSFDGGKSWTQPTYSGYSARGGTAGPGPIGTLPWYFENGLVSDGDPSLAFGPRPGPNGFSWANGARLYYVNLAANFATQRDDEVFRGFEAIALSRSDDVAAAAAGVKSAWLPPVIISQRLSEATFSDKENVWADNAAASRYFGNVYTCWVSFRSKGRGGAPEPVMLSRSTDGGDTWTGPAQLTQAANTFAAGGRQGCTIRTDSTGVVYVFWEGFDQLKRQSVHYMARSFDGGFSFERPRPVANVVDVGKLDPVQGRFTIDGVAGARTDSFPSVDIANGAPSGIGASNKIVLAWADGRNGLGNEEALVQLSTDRGRTWSSPVDGSQAGDRPNFPAVAISPNGQHVYLVYNAFLDPWRENTSAPRRMQGVVRQANGSLSGWLELQRGALGDARGSSANSLDSEFLGDYNYVAATNSFAAAVWNDVRNAADCPVVDAYRQSLLSSTPLPKPAPGSACPPGFGNSDIFAWTSAP